MAFRAYEASQERYEEAKNYLVSSRNLDKSHIERSVNAFYNIVDKCGPVVDCYPSWHPLVSNSDLHGATAGYPGQDCGYQGLDHTRCFRDGFITCPYGDGQDVIDSVEALPDNDHAVITAKKLDVKLYMPNATPILVKCEWNMTLMNDGKVPGSLAIAMFLEREIPCWKWAEVAETWETMRPCFLGSPHGKRSSLFVDEKTGQQMKKIWNSLIESGMFGPIYVAPSPYI